MQIEVVITSVGFGDFLRLSLPVACQVFDCVTVATAPDDFETIEVANTAGAKLHLTDVWRKDGAFFNKSAAINECLGAFDFDDKGRWILLLDADIIVRPDLYRSLTSLEAASLYSVRRRICADEESWARYCAGEVDWQSFPLDPPLTVKTRGSAKPVQNNAALCGYFHLWRRAPGVGLKFMPQSMSAANYDLAFALSFPEDKRAYIADQEVMHLGCLRKNWFGRVSEYWGKK